MASQRIFSFLSTFSMSNQRKSPTSTNRHKDEWASHRLWTFCTLHHYKTKGFLLPRYLKRSFLTILWSGCNLFTNNTAAILDATLHYISATLSFHGSVRQLDHVHFESGKRERHLFQTHYDWTAVPLGTFQNQQSLPGQPLTAAAGSRDGAKTLWRCHSAFPAHLYLACRCCIWLLQLDVQSWRLMFYGIHSRRKNEHFQKIWTVRALNSWSWKVEHG